MLWLMTNCGEKRGQIVKTLRVIFYTLITSLVISGCGENEGTVKTADCREIIYIKESSVETWTKSFTCIYQKTRQGRLMGGYCVNVEYDSNGGCRKSYTYFKKQAEVCLDKANPVLREDDMCYPS